MQYVTRTINRFRFFIVFALILAFAGIAMAEEAQFSAQWNENHPIAWVAYDAQNNIVNIGSGQVVEFPNADKLAIFTREGATAESNTVFVQDNTGFHAGIVTGSLCVDVDGVAVLASAVTLDDADALRNSVVSNFIGSTDSELVEATGCAIPSPEQIAALATDFTTQFLVGQSFETAAVYSANLTSLPDDVTVFCFSSATRVAGVNSANVLAWDSASQYRSLNEWSGCPTMPQDVSANSLLIGNLSGFVAHNASFATTLQSEGVFNGTSSQRMETVNVTFAVLEDADDGNVECPVLAADVLVTLDESVQCYTLPNGDTITNGTDGWYIENTKLTVGAVLEGVLVAGTDDALQVIPRPAQQ